jgi:hypothetical protein
MSGGQPASSFRRSRRTRSGDASPGERRRSHTRRARRPLVSSVALASDDLLGRPPRQQATRHRGQDGEQDPSPAASSALGPRGHRSDIGVRGGGLRVSRRFPGKKLQRRGRPTRSVATIRDRGTGRRDAGRAAASAGCTRHAPRDRGPERSSGWSVVDHDATVHPEDDRHQTFGLEDPQGLPGGRSRRTEAVADLGLPAERLAVVGSPARIVARRCRDLLGAAPPPRVLSGDRTSR